MYCFWNGFLVATSLNFAFLLPNADYGFSILSIITATTSCQEPYIYNPYSDTCIRISESKATYDDAKRECESSGECLVTFKTAAASRWLTEKRNELAAKNPGMFSA